MIYNLLKRVIINGSYDKQELLNKMDVYLLYNRITQAQYDELVAMMNSQA